MDWILTIGVDKFPLTEPEKDFYIKSVDGGAKYVQIRGQLLGTSFQSLVQKEVLEGKWLCDWGNWHDKVQSECSCGYEWIEKDGKLIKIEKPNKELMEL